MEIRPIKNCKLPKYAACIVALASAGLLTGCHTSGEVATDGVIDVPDPTTEEVQLMGEEAVIESEDESVCTTTEEATESCSGCTETLPAESDFQLEGGVAVPEDIEVDGYVAVAPDFDDANSQAASGAELLKNAIIVGFAQQGFPLEPDDTWFDMQSKYKSTDDANLRLCFFDGSVMSEMDNMTGWELVEEMMDATSKEYDWGFTKEIYKASDGVTYRIVYIDLSRCDRCTEDAFAKIAEELKK
jgi:hypothetical protein